MDVNRQYRPDTRVWKRTKPQARRMRQRPTAAETVLWQQLRNRKLRGYKFRRQHPIGQFIADFCCPERKLVIELDGDVHQQTRDSDTLRDEYLQARGFRVMRFSNGEVMNSPVSVITAIEDALKA